MILAGLLGLCVAGLWAGLALILCARLGLQFHQALLYLPLKVVFRVRDRRMVLARRAPAPVIYAITHQSSLDAALMLCLLPADTLHILDKRASSAYWLEPWRALARTIPFNAEHVFFSRRLVRRLKGNGRLAVYLPEVSETDKKGLSIYRAVARIASKADARIVPVFIGGAHNLPFARGRAAPARPLLPRLTISVLEPLTIAELGQRSRREAATASSALLDRLAEARELAPGNAVPRQAA